MSNNVVGFLNKLDTLSEKKVKVHLPSRNQTIETKVLNIKQQKDLISSVLDGVKGSIDFARTLNKIIIENTGDNNLKMYDKIPFIIAMRKATLGSTYTTGNTTIDLARIINNIKTIPFNIADEKSVTIDTLTINLHVPTLAQENILLTRCEQEIDNLDSENLKESVGLMYIFEIVKHIKSVEIEGSTLLFDDIRISDRIKVVEKMPLSVYTEVSSFIEDITKYQSDLLTVDDFEISLDSTFFDSSDR